jgi:signal transduction histidine kinase
LGEQGVGRNGERAHGAVAAEARPPGGQALALAAWPFSAVAGAGAGPLQLAVVGEDDLACRLQALAYEVSAAEARERQRIAQGLHDELGQLLTMVQFKLGELSQGRSAGDGTDPFEDLRQLVRLAVQATRLVTYELHSPLLQQLGLEAAVHGLAQRLQRASTMQVRVQGTLGAAPLAEPMLSVVFRVVRELAQNAFKHARAEQLVITLSRDEDLLQVMVADDGVGFAADAQPREFTPQGGFGLYSIEAQMLAVGGRLSIDSRPGYGTTATVSLGLADGNPLLRACQRAASSAG